MSYESDLIDKLLADNRVYSCEECAYILATVKHETAGTFRPIEEYGKGKNRSYGKPDPETGETYYGRGYVQLTWKNNYYQFTRILGKDLVNEPDLALDPDIAYEIMIEGMTKGLFTGKRLSQYINVDNTDFISARRIINGTDKARLIASYAEAYTTKLLETGAFE